MDKVNKKLPVKIVPSVGMVGSDTLVLGDGENSYIIDLPALFKTAAMPGLIGYYNDVILNGEPNRIIRERIAAMNVKELEKDNA